MNRVFLLIDCGTTNLRVTLLDRQYQVMDVVKAEGGVRHTAIDGHNGQLKALLKQSIAAILTRNDLTPECVDCCVAYGMITSNVGLCEIPHIPAPVSIDDLRSHIQSHVFEEIAPFPIHFIPGVRNFCGTVNEKNFSQMDMMRGEEVEAIGLYHLLGLKESALLILPGSHNKFVSMDAEGRIVGCMTSISGELLYALTYHTILADALKRTFASVEDYDAAMLCEGARECRRSGLGRAAFAGRILNQLGNKSPSQLRSYLMGAVLALDVQALDAFAVQNACVYVAGKAPLQQAMIDVLATLGRKDAVAVEEVISAKMGVTGAVEIALSR